MGTKMSKGRIEKITLSAMRPLCVGMCQQKWSLEFCSIAIILGFVVVKEANAEINATEEDYYGQWKLCCGKRAILLFSLFF